MRAHIRPLLVLAAAASLASTGCKSFLNRFTVNSTAPVLKAGARALDEESDMQFARDAAPASLKTVETFLVTAPDNRDLLEVTAKGYAEFTFGFLEDDYEATGDNDEEARSKIAARATTFYDRAYNYALRICALDEERFPEAMKGDPAALEKLLKERFTSKEDVVGLHWAGLSMGSGINMNKDDMDRVADLPKVILLLERAHALDPSYAHYAPAIALGTVFASQGKAMGGDPDRAKKMFEEAIAGTNGQYLMAKALYARFYATVAQDRPLFEKTLKEVLDANAAQLPADLRLANELAKRRAARYLARAEDWFLPPEQGAEQGTGTGTAK